MVGAAGGRQVVEVEPGDLQADEADVEPAEIRSAVGVAACLEDRAPFDATDLRHARVAQEERQDTDGAEQALGQVEFAKARQHDLGRKSEHVAEADLLQRQLRHFERFGGADSFDARNPTGRIRGINVAVSDNWHRGKADRVEPPLNRENVAEIAIWSERAKPDRRLEQVELEQLRLQKVELEDRRTQQGQLEDRRLQQVQLQQLGDLDVAVGLLGGGRLGLNGDVLGRDRGRLEARLDPSSGYTLRLRTHAPTWGAVPSYTGCPM